MTLAYRASNQGGYKAEIRKTADGFSVFTWHDKGKGVILWREKHAITEWSDAFKIAQVWLGTVASGTSHKP